MFTFYKEINAFQKNRFNIFLKVKLIAITFTLLGCEKQTPETSLLMEEITGKTMGTYYNVKYVVPTDNNIDNNGNPLATVDKLFVSDAISKRLTEINHEISTYEKDSLLSLFNQNPSTEPVKITEGMADNILISQKVGRATYGAMDITVGPLVNLWGFGPDKMPDKVPSDPRIQEAMQRIGLDKIKLFSQHDGYYLQKQIPDLYIDLSTVGEGYGADEIGKVLNNLGITDYLVSVGGTIHSQGLNAQNQPWRVAIEKPTDTEVAVQEAINLKGQSISTAGSYRNYFEKEGIRYSHVIDPKTGKPITHKLISATVISPTALEADAWDTGLMVLGTEKALEVAEKNGLAVYLITKTEAGFEVDMTENFKAFIAK